MSFEKILSELANSPLSNLFKEGYTPSQVRERIINDLSPFFKEKKKLEKYSTNFLVTDWISYTTIDYKKNLFDEYAKITIDTYRKAYYINPEGTMKVMTHLLDMQLESGNSFWGYINLHVENEDLSLRDFTYSVMRELGNVIEGLLKPFLIEHLALSRIIRGKNFNIEDIQVLDIGVIVNELADNVSYPELFKIPPQEMKLSDWRNIAYHSNYRIKNGLIEAIYGSKNNRKSIAITKEDFIEINNKIVLTLKTLNFVHKCFSYEHMEEIYNFKTENNIELDAESRDEVWFLTLATEIVAQGYELLSFEYDMETTKFRLQEMTNEDVKWRSAKAIYLLYVVWQYTLSDKIELIYNKPDNTAFVHASVTSSVCKKIQKGEKKLDYLAENMEHKILI